MLSKAVRIWLRLVRVYQKIDRASVANLRRWELSPAQFDVLVTISAREGIIQQDLAKSLLVTKGNICQLVDRLEQVGLILRRQEGRMNRLYLTRRGHGLVAEVLPSQEALLAQQLEALSPEDRCQLLRLLRKLDRSLG